MKKNAESALQEIRCDNIVKGYKCNRLLGYVEGKYEIQCPKCGEKATGKTEGEKPIIYGIKVAAKQEWLYPDKNEFLKYDKNTKKESVENV